MSSDIERTTTLASRTIKKPLLALRLDNQLNPRTGLNRQVTPISYRCTATCL